MNKKTLLLVSILILVAFTGCEDLQRLFGLLPAGKVILKTGGSTSSTSSSSISISATSTDNFPSEIIFNLEKVELSQDGSNWIEVSLNQNQINSRDYSENAPSGDGWGCGALTLNPGVEIEEGNYTVMRMWFGSSVTAKTSDPFTRELIAEKNRTDFNTKLYPLYAYHNNFPGTISQEQYKYLDHNIEIKEGVEVTIIISVSPTLISDAAVDTDTVWGEFRDNMDRQTWGAIPSPPNSAPQAIMVSVNNQ